MAGFQLSINGRFWVSTEGYRGVGNKYNQRRDAAQAIEFGEPMSH